jgi:hypothetical protein
MDYEKQMKAVKEAAQKLPNTQIGKAVKTGSERRGSIKCDLAYKIFDQAISMYKDGSMEWKDMLSDLTKTLDGLGRMKDKEIEAYMEDEEDED